MPIYTYKCPLCGEVDGVWGHHSEDRKVHEDCGRTMVRVISASRVHPPFHEYIEENMGHEPVVITSRTQRDRLERERGLYGKTNNRWV